MKSDDLEAGFSGQRAFGFGVAGWPQANAPLEGRFEPSLRVRNLVDDVIQQVSERDQLLVVLKSLLYSSISFEIGNTEEGKIDVVPRSRMKMENRFKNNSRSARDRD